jgi:hypothetical protein
MADKKVRPRTLVGLDRKLLYKEWAKEGFAKGCEVGVQLGRNADVMLSTIPNLQLTLVDPYAVYEYKNLRRRNRWKWHQPEMDSYRRKAVKRLARFDVVWLMLPSAAASLYVPDEALDFVYIDGNHGYDFIMQDIILWAPKVRSGGVISGHDYGISAVRRAVTMYAGHHQLEISVTDRACEPGQSRTVVSWILRKS